MRTTLPEKDVLLWGAGHTNLGIIKRWRMRPAPEARLTLIANSWQATYSGMLPGTLAGQYPREAMEIDLVRLCASAGVRLIVGEVTGLDLLNQALAIEGRPDLPFDALSIGIGSIPTFEGTQTLDDSVLPVKPMPTFLDRLSARLSHLSGPGPFRITVVGGGAAGLELAFCLPRFVQTRLGKPTPLTLIDASDLAPDPLSARARHRLAATGATLLTGRRVVFVENGQVHLEGGTTHPADLVVWATGASAPPILRGLGLPTGPGGFLLTRETLQTVAEAPIFAVGDSGTLRHAPTPKAGVYAVRQVPVLWENLNRTLQGRPLKAYKPQRRFLRLLNTGDGRALGDYHGLPLAGGWCWALKDAIDRRFIAKFQDYRPMAPTPEPTSSHPLPMRCAGCGGKIGGSVLSNALRRLELKSGPQVLVGLDAPDDASLLRPTPGLALALTADFFAAPLDDPYLVGRIAALHAASDAYAMGARPFAALALAVLPTGPPRRQEQWLYELLAGSLREFDPMGVSLVGGHTIEGPQLTYGFTITAESNAGPPRTKGAFRPGDRLVLTKPLGTGALLAAHGRALCSAAWFTPLLAALLTGNREAAAALEAFPIAGITDITGFGLAGHLLEVLRAAGLDADLDLDAVPLLPGTLEVLASGLESTLAPDNRTAEEAIDAEFALRESPRFAALFDPQTCGGLLLGVPEASLAALLDGLRASGSPEAACIGTLRARRGPGPRLRVRQRATPTITGSLA